MLDRLLDFLSQFLERLLPAFIVLEYQRAAFFRAGRFRNVRAPGWHWKIPLLDDFDIYTVATTTLSLPVQSATTKDGIAVVAKAMVRYKITDLSVFAVEVADQIDALGDTTCGIILSAIEAETWETGRASDLDGIVTRKARAAAKKWGIEVEAVTFTDLAQMRSIRLFNEQAGEK